MDVETGEHRGDAPARLVHGEQLGHDVAERVVAVVGRGERDLRHGVVQHPGGDRVPFGVVGVEEASGDVPLTTWASFHPRLTASCTPVLRPWPPCGGVHVRGVTGEQHPAAAVGGGLAGMSVKREIQVGLCTPKSVP